MNNNLHTLLNNLLKAVYDPDAEKEYPWLPWIWLIGLWLIVAVVWGSFLHWGKIPFDWQDWAEINAPRTAFLKDAVTQGVLPLHMPDSSALRGITDRFMALPDMLLSPQILLLRFMSVGTFFFINTLLSYTIGAFGLLWFRRKYSLSLASFTILFLLFNMNGHIQAHYSIGHTTWSAYFFFPWLAVMIFQWLEGDKSWRWVAKTSLILFIIYLQGGFHHFVWGLIFIGLLGLTSWEKFWPALKVLVSACMLSMVRILPSVLIFGIADNEFLGGYPTVWDLLLSMVTFKYPSEAMGVRTMLCPLSWWEYDLYLGIIGTAFLVGFGIYAWVKNRREETGYPALLLPITGMTVLSIGRVYRLIREIPIPLLSGERASIRLVILPIIFLLILAAIEFQSWLKKHQLNWSEQVTGLGLILLIGHDLWQHAKVWMVSNAFSAFDVTPVDLSIKTVANHPDPQYFAMLGAGAALTVLTLIFLIYMWQRESKKQVK